jgi:type IV secretory pathway VirB10-like protein
MKGAVRRSLLVLAAVFALAGVARADEMKPEAKAHLDRGLELYGQKDYAAAIAEFEAGYAIDARPEFLYAEAQAERMNSDCKSAIGHYQAFLDTLPAPEREAAALANIARCKSDVKETTPPTATLPPTASAQPAPPPPSAAPAAPPPSAAPPPPAVTAPVRQQNQSRSRSEPFYTDVFGDVLVASGVVALGVGGVLYAASVRNENKSQDESTAVGTVDYQAHGDRTARGSQQRSASVVLGAAGLLLVTGGVLHWVLRSPSQEVGVVVLPGGAAVSYGRAF